MPIASRATLIALLWSAPCFAADAPPGIIAAPALARTSEILDAADAARFLPSPVVVEKLATGLKFTEGPVWFPASGGAEGYLLFSDIPANQIKKWSAKEGLTVFRDPSNFTNGNARDAEGRLISCEHAARRVTRTEADGTITVLADQFDGRKLNSPNDVAVHSSGVLYFTDPTYGLPKGQPKEQTANNVYRLDPKTKEIKAVVSDFDMPNGLAFSPNFKTLYVADSGKPKHIRALPVNADGTLGAGAVFCKLDKGAPDGIKVDPEGRIFSSSGDGVQVFSPKGELVARILIPESAANLAFGGPTGRDLFITARTSLYRVALKPAATAAAEEGYAAVIEATISRMTHISGEMKGVIDTQGANLLAAKIKTVAGELKALKAESDKLPAPSKEESQRLQAKYGDQLTLAMTEFQNQATRIAISPDLMTPEMKEAFEALAKLK